MIITNKEQEILPLIEGLPLKGAVVLIDKPKSWSSFDICKKMRGILKIKKIGHAGTLDPLATGLLIICAGKATKTMTDYQDLPKEYRATVKLGATTATLDTEFEEENIKPTEHLTVLQIQKAVKSFIGQIEQIPPIYSAKKVDGKQLYKLARKGKEANPRPTSVEIYDINIQSINNPEIDLTVRCSKGTYIRTLAKDIGDKLGCGGYLTSLRRTAIGEHRVEDAFEINLLAEKVKQERAKRDENLQID